MSAVKLLNSKIFLATVSIFGPKQYILDAGMFKKNLKNKKASIRG